MLYHYPSTKNSGVDSSDVVATKAAKELGFPLFVVVQDATNRRLRHVRLGWVDTWDDDLEEFLVSFGEDPPVSSTPLPDSEFDPMAGRRVKDTKGRVQQLRPDQARFSLEVRRRYGTECAMCGLTVPALLEAAHLVPGAQGGADDSRNGLLLCSNHHRALEARLVVIDPRSGRFMASTDGPHLGILGVTRPSLEHLSAQPSPKTSASASGASYRLCGVQTWGVLRFERPRTRVLRAQTGCFRSLYGSPGARFLTPGDTGAESARCAAGWAEAFGAVLSEAGSLDGTPDAEQSVDRGLPPDDP